MARIYQREDRGGFWYLDYKTPAGKRIRKKLGRSHKLAKQSLADYELKVQRGELGFDTTEISLEEFWKKSVDYSRAINSESQAVRIGYVIKNFEEFLAQSYPGLKRLSQFTSEVFQAFQQHRLASVSKRSKKPVKRKTVNIEVRALKTMLKRAIEWGYLRENPCRVRMLKLTDSKKVRSLTEPEVTNLLSNSRDHWLHPIINTMLYSGLRTGECRWLTWDDIDFKEGIVHIRRKEGWIPKSSGGEIRERDVYIGDELVAFLQRHKLASRHDDERVFHDKRGQQLSKYPSAPFSRITKQLGFGDVTRLHALRHTYITHLLRAGNDIATVQEQAGHTDIKTTRGYIDVFEDRKRQAAQSLTYVSNNDNRGKKEKGHDLTRGTEQKTIYTS